MSSAAATHTQTQPRTVWRDDLVAALTGGLLILGLFLDGWNHLNLQQGKAGDFLTPWHGVLYAGFNACAIWAITRNERLRSMLFPSRGPKRSGGRRVTRAARRELNPAHLALAGLALAGVGVVGDAVARATGLRPEAGAVGAPFDFLLFTGAGLIFAVALRSMSVSLPAISRRVAVPAVLAAGAVVAAVIAFGGTAAKQSVDHAVARTPASVAAAPAQRLTVAAHARHRAVARSHAAARPAHHHARPAHHAAAATTVLVAERPQGSHVSRAQHVHHVPAVVVQRHALVRTPAPVRRQAARPAPQRHAAARPHRGRFTPVAVPQTPSNTVTTQVTTTVSSSSSSAASPKPAAAKPALSPTASPTPASPPATPPATAPSNGGNSGGPH